MKTSLNFHDSSRSYSLKSAVLIYTDGQSSAASFHEVCTRDSQPVILPGQPITYAAVDKLLQTLGRNQSTCFISDRIVSLGMERIAWWCPAGRRRIWFKPSLNDKAREKALKAISGKFVHHPPLLFVVGRGSGLSVFALVKNERPQPSTRLWRAPYWNLDEEGFMCRGNLNLPVASPDNIGNYEKAFFNSAFSHHSSGQRLTCHPAGHDGLWQELSLRKTPPETGYWVKHLCRTSLTVNSLFK